MGLQSEAMQRLGMMPDVSNKDAQIERLCGQIFDLKASLDVLVSLMQEDIDSGKVRATMVRKSLLADARNLSRHDDPVPMK